MFRLGVIEESLSDRAILAELTPFFVKRRVAEVSDDAVPVWHINEYHVPESALSQLLPALESGVKPSWYAHAFNDEKLVIVLHGKSFSVSLTRDETWGEMIAYGETVDVERKYLENIPLRV